MDQTATQTTDIETLLSALRTKANEHADDRAFGAHCRASIVKICKDRTLAAFVDSSGFGEVSPIESFRRLALLRDLKSGTFCTDRTWGFGIVRKMDDFYKKVTLDFDGKPGHQMTYAYAAETLVVVDDNHLLARRHKDPAGLEKLILEQPDEIVRLALRTFGPMPVARLEKTLADARIITPSRWKTFWEGARKALKKDPLTDIPSKRNDSITLLSRAQEYGASWLAALGRERDIERILTLIKDLEEQAPEKIEPALAVLSDRLTFAIKGAYNSDPSNYARLAITVQRLGLSEPQAAPLQAHLWEDNRFITAAEKLSLREAADLAGYLLQDSSEAHTRMIALLPVLPYNLAVETLRILYEGPEKASANTACQVILQAADPHPVFLTWAIRNHTSFTEWHLPPYYDLLMKGVSLLDEKHSGEALRLQHTIRLVFDHVKGFETTFKALDPLQKQAIFERIQASATWDSTSRRHLLTRMIKIAPKLKAHRKTTSTDSVATAVRQTSWRSLAERQAAHRRLVEVDLPQNSKDIATARSYGDLRENFEYQTAKHQQGLLLQRQAEMDAELKQVKGTDFTNAPTDKVTAGTTVTFTLPDASASTYTILGEWDRDEALNIISCKSRLAECLLGRHVGNRVLIPSETGEDVATITTIAPLSETVRAWVTTRPPSQATEV